MTEYQQRIELENLSEAFISANKPLVTLPPDEDFEVEDLEDEDFEDEGDEETSEIVPVKIEPTQQVFAFAGGCEDCEEQKLAKKHFMVICDNTYKLKELANSENFLDIFEPWMLDKLSVVSDALASVANTAKFNSLSVGD